MTRWQRALLGAGALLLGLVACGTDDVTPEEAASLAAATSGPLAYTTTYAFELPEPVGTVDGTIEGSEAGADGASFVVSATGTPPRTLTLDSSALGRLAVVPTDVFGLVDTDLEADGSGRGYGQDEVARFRESLDPAAVQAGLSAFLTEVGTWIVGTPPAAVTVSGATLELLVLADGSAVDSAVLRVDYAAEGFDGTAEFRVNITG